MEAILFERGIQHHMPRRRLGYTTAVTIGGERFYLTANARADASLGEVFIQWGKQGSTRAGLMDLYAIGLSVGLQHGVPLYELVEQGLGTWFIPNGHTDDPDFPKVGSVVDWIARRLAADWLTEQECADLGVFTLPQKVEKARPWLDREAATLPSFPDTPINPAELEAFMADLHSGLGRR